MQNCVVSAWFYAIAALYKLLLARATPFSVPARRSRNANRACLFFVFASYGGNSGGNSPLANSSKANDFGAQPFGIFCEPEIPYLITVADAGATDAQSFIAYSPNQAPVQFLPVKKTVFANNTTTLSLTDGILTKADSDVGGEITGFVALPADAIGAYMTAVGNVFNAFKTNTSNACGRAFKRAMVIVQSGACCQSDTMCFGVED